MDGRRTHVKREVRKGMDGRRTHAKRDASIKKGMTVKKPQLLKAEHLKMKRTFGRKLVVMAVVVNLLLTLLLTGGIPGAFPAGAWNWWYTILLPGMLAILCYLCMKREKKIKYYNMLALQIPVEKNWMGKIIYVALGLFISNALMFAGTWLGGMLLGTTITPLQGMGGAVLLTISYLWEIPLYLFLSSRCGMFVSMFVSMALSVSGVITLADTEFWWLHPASVPVRLMCPTLGILPNGLQVSDGSALASMNVIVPGVLLSGLWFVIFTLLTMVWIRHMEAKE